MIATVQCLVALAQCLLCTVCTVCQQGAKDDGAVARLHWTARSIDDELAPEALAANLLAAHLLDAHRSI